MSSNLKVNTILPSTGTSIGIGTAGGLITSNSPLTIASGGINVTGVSTFSSDTHVGTGITFHTNGQGEFAGVVTFTANDQTRAAHFPNYKRAVFGSTSLYGSIYNTGSNLTFEALNQTTFKCWNGVGQQTWLYVNGISGRVDIGGGNLGNSGDKQPLLRVVGHNTHQIEMHSSDGTNLTERFRLSQSGFNFTGLSTHTGNFDLDGDLDVDGHTNLDNVSVAGILTVSSGTSGDAKLIIEADTDNNDEGDNPTLVFKQDGGIEVSSIGHGLLSGDQNGLVIANSCTNGYLKFATGSTNGHTNATERLTITQNGKFCLGTYNSNFASNDGIVSIVNAAGAGTENTLLTLWNPTTVADARAGIDFLTNAHYGTGRDGAFIRGSNDGVTAKAHLQFGTIKDETYTENFRISADGNVTKPNSCCFQAVVNGSHISAGSYVVFGSVDVNRGNDYNSSNGIFTAPVTGTYLFHISSIAFNNATTVFRFYLRINNGNTGSGNDAHLRLDMNNDDADYAPNASYTYYKYMSANDTARVYFIPDDNSANAYGGSDYFKFGGHLVG